MFIWTCVFLSLFLSVKLLVREASQVRGLFGFTRKKRELARVTQLLRELEETLLAGLVPKSQRWEDLKALPEPWGALSYESLTHLRESGGALLPTLRRLRALAEDQVTALIDARTKSSQAFAQAIACASLVPVLGLGLYAVVPGLEQNTKPWLFACICALILSGLGALWLLQIGEKARWGGLSPQNRVWILGSQCAGERFLAAVRCGTPPDLAWSKAIDFLTPDSRELALAWGRSIWEDRNHSSSNGIETAMIAAGASIKKSVQISLMEGRPCTERVESALLSLRKEISSFIERELSLLSTRALKPLFVCVAPALLGLLIFGLWLTAQETLGEAGFSAF
jgi:hypothetical protein